MGAMTPREIATLRALMEYEAGRRAPPAEFPRLPDLPGGRYTDPRFMALEKAHLWRKSWLLAGHTDEVPQPGCFKLWEDAGQPVVILRARSGAINAFYNTCSHRGAAVVTEASGRRARLTCKYHGWTYDDEGALVSIRDPEDFADFDFSCRSLRKVRCETYGALIFVNFDPEAPSLRDWLGPIAAEWEEFRFDWGDGDKPDGWADVVSGFNTVLEEDTAFGAWIQKSHESYAFESVPLSYQEARIYWWNQAADALIGSETIPPELRVAPVIGDAWVHPNDPRLAHLREPSSRSLEEIPA